MTRPDTEPSNPLWDFALQLYDCPGVKPAVLALQDRAGANVNLLLWACWLQSRDQHLDTTAITAAQTAIEPLHQQWVVPVRALRRSAADVGLTELKQGLLTAELRAERLVIDRLHAFSQDYPWRQFPADELNVRNYLHTLDVGETVGWEACEEAVATLQRATAGLAAGPGGHSHES